VTTRGLRRLSGIGVLFGATRLLGGCTSSFSYHETPYVSSEGGGCAYSGTFLSEGGGSYYCNNGFVCDEATQLCVQPNSQTSGAPCGGSDECQSGLICNAVAQRCQRSNTVALGERCAADDECESNTCVPGGTDRICCAAVCVASDCVTDRCANDGRGCVPIPRGTVCSLPPPPMLSTTVCLDEHTFAPKVCDGAGKCAGPSLAMACPRGWLCPPEIGSCMLCRDDGDCDAVAGYRCAAGLCVEASDGGSPDGSDTSP
jgi:hypothetical protein